METIAAVGAASSVAQLLGFAIKVITAGTEIHASLDGSLIENEKLETVLERMLAILETVGSLSTSSTSPSATLQGMEPLGVDMEHLSRDAMGDCNEILRSLRELKNHNGGHRRFGSLVSAFKSLMGRKKIELIERRLRRECSAISLRFSTTVYMEVQRLKESVQELNKKSDDHGINSHAHIAQLSQSLGALQITSDEIMAKANSLNFEDHQDIQAQGGMSGLIEKATGQLKSAFSVKEDVTVAANIISSLYFEALPIRHEAIASNYKNTSKWIYLIPSFRGWLGSGNGIFWISGKPGSGKSTLMKYLADNYETERILTEWSKPHKVTIAAHYFWYLGTAMQKSLLGLLRTLVFDILRKMPWSVRSLCPSRWKQASENILAGTSQNWTMDELSVIVHGLSLRQEDQIRLCIFVDGLDEFDGDHLEICKLLASLAASSCIKICVASRPWNIFEDEFRSERRLHVHELTGPDMEETTKGRLFSHSFWKTSNNKILQEDVRSLIHDIRQRANGVFLWVVLVTKSLCDGLTNRDTIHDLRRRLELLPTDLNALFKLILSRVDPAYLMKSAECLQIALHATTALPPQAYYYHELDHEDSEYALSDTLAKSSREEIVELQQLSIRRIVAVTGGLLEIQGKDPAFGVDSVKPKLSVNFLHRTVAEFLRTRDVEMSLHGQARVGFNVHVALAKICTVLARDEAMYFVFHRVSDNYCETLLEDLFFRYLPLLEPRHFDFTARVLSAVERWIGGMMNRMPAVKRTLIHSNIVDLVSQRLSADKDYFWILDPPPLAQVLSGKSPNIRMVSVLINHGACDLNKPIGDSLQSPWAQYALDAWEERVEDYFPAFQRLISTAGADPNGVVQYLSNVQTVFSLLLDLVILGKITNLSAYLQTISVCLEHGADFEKQVSTIGHVSDKQLPESPFYEVENVDMSGYATVIDLFCGQLSWFGLDGRVRLERSDRMIRVAFETTKLILDKRSRTDDLLVARLRKTIPRAFPVHMARVLLGRIPGPNQPSHAVPSQLQLGRRGDGRVQEEGDIQKGEMDSTGSIQPQRLLGKGKRVSEINRDESAGIPSKIKRRRVIEVIVLSSDEDED